MNLLTVNIEKKLLKENKKLATPQELLKIKEFDRVGKIDNAQVLTRLGMDSNLRRGENIKNQISRLKIQTHVFDQTRVFHISQIESICNKYYLKFLPVHYFKGSIDAELPQKLTTFEVAHGIQLGSSNSYIIAPHKSFELEERPKDPLFFYQINSEYYYLIHKWGNDLSIFRRLISASSKVWFLISCFVLLTILSGVIPAVVSNNPNYMLWCFAGLIASLICFATISDFGFKRLSFMPKNTYNSHYKDKR